MSPFDIDKMRSVDLELKASGGGAIYIVAWKESGPVKIGKTVCLEKRLISLQCGNPEQLFIFGAIIVQYGKIGLSERRIHHGLRNRRLKGEWFDIAAAEAIAWCEAILSRTPVERAPSPAKTAHRALRKRYLEVLTDLGRKGM